MKSLPSEGSKNSKIKIVTKEVIQAMQGITLEEKEEITHHHNDRLVQKQQQAANLVSPASYRDNNI